MNRVASGISEPSPHLAPPATEVDPGPPRILIVDDNRDGAEGLMLLLQLRRYRVELAHDGSAALEIARAFQPDVMLVDIGLPGIDGYEVARRLRDDPALRGSTLVAITGYGGSEDRRRALAAGFDHHLTKPVRIETLEPLLERRGPRAEA